MLPRVAGVFQCTILCRLQSNTLAYFVTNGNTLLVAQYPVHCHLQRKDKLMPLVLENHITYAPTDTRNRVAR